MDLDILITGGVGILATIVSGFTSWFFTKRKYNAEVDNDVIENMEKSLNFYIKLSDDNAARLEKIIQLNEALENEVKELKRQVKELTSQLERYKN